ncbi:extracellular solute-binding protein [Fictibacillus enclensis]|uniref:extracellular solute-binding protein n=1 Tax=Fictibacillus enclensis TaxID=1017270 RepID=UPI0025A07714|nr:extracellular solute-binding protein [Fictibacillus enclensis]MDM5197957.1 extracellular solute-binding protein [Fictibacillus enclensis]
MKCKWVLRLAALLLIFQTVWSPAQTFAEKNDTKSLLNDLFDKKKTNVVNKKTDEKPSSGKQADESLISKMVESSYSDVLAQWKKAGLKSTSGKTMDISLSGLSGTKGRTEMKQGKKAVRFDEQMKELSIPVEVPESGLYQLSFDYMPLKENVNTVERGIKVNGKYPFFEARRIVFDRKWESPSGKFPHDEKGNEYPHELKEVKKWQKIYAMDASYFEDKPLLFYLKKGKNTVSLEYVREPMLLGQMHISSPVTPVTYKDYETDNEAYKKPSKTITLEAERFTYKNVPYIQPVSLPDANVEPYSVKKDLLNTLGTPGDKSFELGGQKVTWKINVKEAGTYHLSFKYLQDQKVNMPVFRTVLIDGKIPFQELEAYPFSYNQSWSNETLGSKGKPYNIHLDKGEHTLSLIVNGQPIQRTVTSVRKVMDDIKKLSLRIKMATGNTVDRNREWEIATQIPDLKQKLTDNADKLSNEYTYLQKISGNKPDAARNLMMAANQLRKLAKNPNEVPDKLSMLDQGSGSASQQLGDLLAELPNQRMQLDRIYISNGELPDPEAGWATKIGNQVSKFFLSFNRTSQPEKKKEKKLIVWVNRPQQYVSMMQQMADQDFTQKTGIKISFSIMPDEQKLILANAANKSPDVALGVSNQLPYNMALRGAVLDLKQFPDFQTVNKRFSPGAMLPFYFDDGVYAIPETQNFWVMFYRKDILDALHMKVPQTWDQVLNMLPELQRYGMNFYTPLSQAGGFKPFHLTTPYLYQFGGSLYTKDGMKAAIGTDEALKGFELMTKAFTIYSMSMQVPNFYNHFREGNLPIGISDYETYVQLTSAAPELAGWWKIAPQPGVRDEHGKIQRWAPGTGQSALIFKKTKQKDEAWEFLKWWTSEDVQQEYGTKMEVNYGPSYKWNTSNLEAFKGLPWPDEDKKVINEQWKWLKDVTHVPGDYMLEREISNAWNSIVFDGENPRKALEDAIVLSNREMKKKQEEFGYVKNGKVVKKIKMPKFQEK